VIGLDAQVTDLGGPSPGKKLLYLRRPLLEHFAAPVASVIGRRAVDRDRAEWEFSEAQSANSTHVEFPRVIDRMLHGVFDHTAHHLDVKVPFYRLRQVQSELDGLLNTRNVVLRWSWREFQFLRTVRVCKLYNYGCWPDFSGRPKGFVNSRREA